MKIQIRVLLTAAAMVLVQTSGTGQGPVGAAANAVLSVSNGLPPPAAGPVAPMPLMLLRESLGDVLKKNGTSLVGWANACRTGLPACKESLYGVEPVFVQGAMTDPSARASFAGVPPGSYFVFGQTLHDNQFLVWDLKVDLRAGANMITLDQRNIALLNGAPPPAAAASSQPRPALDPSIAKARAAKVDTRVFGIPLGEPLQLPTCDPLQPGSVLSLTDGQFTPPATCISEVLNMATGLLSALFPVKIDGMPEDVKTIMLAKESCPLWMTTCEAYGTVHEGLLVAVVLGTKGRDVEAAVAKELRGKYGQPTLVKAGTVDPDVGNPFRVNDLEWTLPGLHVEYQVVFKVEGGDRVRTNEGLVRIETELSAQLRRTKEQEQTRPRL